jgi:hypothetical protein
MTAGEQLLCYPHGVRFWAGKTVSRICLLARPGMRSEIRIFGVAALFTLLLGVAALAVPGCGGKERSRNQQIERYSDELREAVSDHVSDQQRKAQMLLIVDQVEAVQLRFSQETTEFVASYRKLNADYDSTRPAFEQLFSDYNAKRSKARSEVLERHFQLASLATPDEWDSIWKAETKLYEKVNAARPAAESAK